MTPASGRHEAEVGRDRPIIFSGPMVRALLAGTKTQTRRVLPTKDIREDIPSEEGEDCELRGWLALQRGDALCAAKARFAVGDRLWVRETWQTGSGGNSPQIAYRATGDCHNINAWDGEDEGAGPSFNYDRCPGATWHTWLPDLLSGAEGSWRSPIHMPRWASRLTLIVTDVRVERLQDISEADAVAEGTQEPTLRDLGGDLAQAARSERQVYSRLWNSLHGPDAWAANPWVCAVSFEVERRNIDTTRQALASAQDPTQ